MRPITATSPEGISNRDRQRAFRANHPDYYKSRDADLMRRYGLTRQTRAALLAKQGGGCAICSAQITSFGRKSGQGCVDHCHKTLVVRGVVCMSCNRALGQGRDCPAILEEAAKYLRRTGALDYE